MADQHHQGGGGGGGNGGGGNDGNGHRKPVPVIKVPKPKPGDDKPGDGKPGGGFNDHQQNAFDMFMSIMESYGFTDVGEIAKVVKKAILDGITDASQLDLLVRDTNEWRTRFAGNEILKANGQNVLSVSQYLATETAMAQVMKQAGLPLGFYDNPSDFAKFIGGQVSPAELQGRVTDAVTLMNRNDQAIVDNLSKYGLSQGDLLAYYLDPTKAAPILMRQTQSVLIGAAAERAGVDTNTAYTEHLADLGVSEQQAAQGFQTVSDLTSGLSRLGEIYGQEYGVNDAESEIFDGGSSTKRKALASQERASFSGSSGTSGSSLGKTAAGSY